MTFRRSNIHFLHRMINILKFPHSICIKSRKKYVQFHMIFYNFSFSFKDLPCKNVTSMRIYVNFSHHYFSTLFAFSDEFSYGIFTPHMLRVKRLREIYRNYFYKRIISHINKLSCDELPHARQPSKLMTKCEFLAPDMKCPYQMRDSYVIFPDFFQFWMKERLTSEIPWHGKWLDNQILWFHLFDRLSDGWQKQNYRTVNKMLP